MPKVTNIRSLLGNDIVDSLEKAIQELIDDTEIDGLECNVDNAKVEVNYISFKVKEWPLGVSA